MCDVSGCDICLQVGTHRQICYLSALCTMCNTVQASSVPSTKEDTNHEVVYGDEWLLSNSTVPCWTLRSHPDIANTWRRPATVRRGACSHGSATVLSLRPMGASGDLRQGERTHAPAVLLPTIRF